MSPLARPGLACHTTDRIEGLDDGRLVSPSAERNAGAIIEALGPALAGRSGLMLEIGSGTGQHAAAFAAAFPALDWQPSDPFELHLDSVRAWVAHAARANLRAPLWLDAAEPWSPFDGLTGVIAVNVIHICPWVVTRGIVREAGAALPTGGLMIFYGPFMEAGAHTGEGNAAFDRQLREMDPAWGLRDVDDIAALAAKAGFGPAEVLEMPVNNRTVLFRKV